MGKTYQAVAPDTAVEEAPDTRHAPPDGYGNAFRQDELKDGTHALPEQSTAPPSRVMEQMGLEAPQEADTAQAPAVDPLLLSYRSASASLLADAARLRALDREVFNWQKVYRSTLGVNQKLLEEGSHGTSAAKLRLLAGTVKDLDSTRYIVSLYAGQVLPVADEIIVQGDHLSRERMAEVVRLSRGAPRAVASVERQVMEALSRASVRDERIGDVGRARIARAELAEDIAELFAETCKGLARRMVVAWFKAHAPWAQVFAIPLFDASWAGVEAYFQRGILQGNFDGEEAIKTAVVKGAESMVAGIVDLLLKNGGGLDTSKPRGSFGDADAGPDATERLAVGMIRKMLIQFVRAFFSETFGNDRGAQEAAKIALQKVSDPETLVKNLAWHGFDELFGVKLSGFVR